MTSRWRARSRPPAAGGALQPASSATGELTDRVRGAVHDRGDLGIGHGEQVMQDEHHTLDGAERVKHHKQRGPDRLGEKRVLFGVELLVSRRHRLGRPLTHRLLASRLA
jgi:hypothetical protein